MTTKITSANVDNTIPSSTDVDGNNFNISLLGFKIAVNEGLTVFNLTDGIVDEFNDESGTDDSEGSNQNYNATDDIYNNFASKPISAGFGTSSVSEPSADPDGTSTALDNPAGLKGGTHATFTVPVAMTSVTAYMWGTGGGGGNTKDGGNVGSGGGGGFVTGDISVTPGQSFYVFISKGGSTAGNAGGGASGGRGNSGGGLSYLGTIDGPQFTSSSPQDTPNIYMIAGGGGGGGYVPNPQAPSHGGGGGGGTQGNAGGANPSGGREQTTANDGSGGGGSQSAGGQGGNPGGVSGSFLQGGSATNDPSSGGGGGYYGGGGSGNGQEPSPGNQGGGGSSYFGNPNVTSGSSTGAVNSEASNIASPFYPGAIHDPNPTRLAPVGLADGGVSSNPGNTQNKNYGGDGYVLLAGTQGTGSNSASIVSNSFTASSEPSTARIVVFEENVDTPTLNTDIIARVSRDGGATYSNATLSDAGYVTGSSGQRILTGTVDVSGQPTGTSMRWKLDLANNEIKVHGVSLQWG